MAMRDTHYVKIKASRLLMMISIQFCLRAFQMQYFADFKTTKKLHSTVYKNQYILKIHESTWKASEFVLSLFSHTNEYLY